MVLKNLRVVTCARFFHIHNQIQPETLSQKKDKWFGYVLRKMLKYVETTSLDKSQESLMQNPSEILKKCVLTSVSSSIPKNSHTRVYFKFVDILVCWRTFFMLCQQKMYKNKEGIQLRGESENKIVH